MVSLVPGRVPGDIEEATKARDHVESILNDSFFERAPFKQIGVIIRYGQRSDYKPEYEPIKRGELPIAVEAELSSLRKLRGSELCQMFQLILLEALIDVGEKYGLFSTPLIRERAKIQASRQ